MDIVHSSEVINLCDSVVLTGGIQDSGVSPDLQNNTEISKNEISMSSDVPLVRETSAKKKKTSFNCLVCGKKFNQNAGLYNHMKKVHNILRGDKTNIRCLEKGCVFKCSYKEKLQYHLCEEHGFNMDIRVETFQSYIDFLRWKEEFEKQEKTRFVKKSGSRSREKGVRVVYFYCSRSGTSNCQNNLDKQMVKRKATTKSNHHCTASITCVELASGRVEVKVCATHYGHDTDLQQLRLSQTEKIQIVEQLVKGLPRDLVLDNIRSSASADMDRIHLITIKDVKNIEKAYRIQSNTSEILASKNMFCNISNWVTLMSQTEHTPVVYFQERGASDLTDYEFTLVLMTVGQIEMAKKYGQSGIFYIPTYTTNDNKYCTYNSKAKNTYEIHIATLIVVDGSNDTVPISFMISTNINKARFKLFFECVKLKVPEITAKAVLTDDNNDIFQAWASVFTTKTESGEKPCHLWSNRFVDKDWRDNLITIPNEEIQESIYEKLYSYLESTDETKIICNTLKDYVDNELVINPLTIQFGNHFALKYLGSEAFWAGCYGKKSVSIHAQLNMERLSNEIEELVDKKHFDKRFIVRTVQDLLKLISDNQCHRQAKFQRQVQELPTHHKLALRINPEAISQNSASCWRVNSSKDPEKIFSIVTKQEEKCPNPNPCLLFCANCKTCAHEFQCSCRFFAFDKTMCKHIHAVAMKFTEQTHILTSKGDNSQNSEKELAVLKNEEFWGRRRIKKIETPDELNTDLSIGEGNILPIIHEMIHNRKIKETKRKRGRPKKNKGGVIDSESSDEEESRKSYRSKVNILRKSKKIIPFKSEDICDQDENSKNH